MATYILLNIIFLGLVLTAFRIKPRLPSRLWWLVAIALLLLTAVFDSILIFTNIIAYDDSKLLGIYIGKAPLEDFFYAVLAVIIIPVLWNRFNKEKR